MSEPPKSIPWSGPSDGPPPRLCTPEYNAKRAATPKPVLPVVQSGEDVNTKPISPACFEVERWQQRSGSAGFSVNGYLLGGRKR
jgi:hypothetical protein